MRSARLKAKMAIYHLSAKTVSRGSASAKARHDYIEREGRYQADREEVTHSQSGNMPEWAKEHPRDYWDSADVYERGNGRLFKQLEFALPKELNTEQQKELVQTFVDKIMSTKDGPLPYSYAVHKGHDKENPHCHLMISERALDGHQRTPETWFKRANSRTPEKGGAKKTEALKPKEWLQEIRQEWGQQANRALERAGIDARIDHRSLEAQGITDRQPTQHLGPAVAAMEAKGIQTERAREVPQGENSQVLRELAEARAQKAAINDGMSEARQRFQAEKERRQQEKERQKEVERQRKEALERQREAQKEKEKQEDLERLQEQRQKSRGMGFSR